MSEKETEYALDILHGILPTIEQMAKDMMGIVRCKECKYWNKHHFVDIYVCSVHNEEGQYPYLMFEMEADDFCSRGEKRDDSEMQSDQNR